MAKKKEHYKSKAPKGLKVTRDGYKFTFSWTNGETYKDVDLLIKVNGKPKKGFPYKAGAKDLKNSKVTITFPYKYKYKNKKGKTKTITFNPKTSVSFTVRGLSNHSLSKKEKKKYDKVVESDYAKNWGVFKINYPSSPVVRATWAGEDYATSSVYTINIANADKANKRWFLSHRWRWVTQFQGESPVVGSWNTVEDSTNTKTKEETDISGKAFKRTIEAYSIGKRGNSPRDKKGKTLHKSASHVYSKPYDPSNIKIISASEGADGTKVRVTWSHKADGWHPIDKTECQYVISSPAAGMTAPKNLEGTVITTHTHVGDERRKASWTDGDSFETDKVIEPNQCMFIRIHYIYDAEHNYSNWVKVPQLKSVLTDPTGLSLDTQMQGNVLRVTVTNSAVDEVPDSFIAVSYKSAGSDGVYTTPKIIGIMPHNNSGYLDVRLPSDPEDPPSNEKIGVQAIAYGFKNEDFKSIDVDSNNYDLLKEDLYYKSGESYVKVTNQEYSSSLNYYSYYSIDIGTIGSYKYKQYTLPVLDNSNSMLSNQLWEEGDFPKPPSNFEVESVTSTTAKATWEWSWSGATHIELSWSDSEDAWESTEEPSTYRVPVNRAVKWYIKGLTSGEIWYVRSRFIRVNNDDTETIGPWSIIKPLNLTAAPTAPVLTLSTNVATENQDIIASWVYTSNDGTPQSLAEIYLETTDSYGTRIGFYRPASEKLLIDSQTGSPIFDDTLTYYTFNEGIYTKENNPDSSHVEDYYIFDDSTPVIQTVEGSTAQQITFVPSELNLKLGETYNFVLRLTAKSSAVSEWSKSVQLEIAEPLEPPIISASAQFVPETISDVIFGDTFSLTNDVSISSEKSYYTLTGAEVDDPAESELDLYYEKSNGVYSKTQDTSIVSGKTYYYIHEEMVIDPVVEDIGSYYELDYTTSTRAVLSLKSLPIVLNVTGAGSSGVTIITIERSGDFFTDKPDESIESGYDEEIVAMLRIQGEGQIAIDRDNGLMGYLDDGASYRLVATIIDENGQTATEDHMRASVTSETFSDIKSILCIRSVEKPYVYVSVENETFDSEAVYYYTNEFTVSWAHQPIEPIAVVEIDEEHLAAKITADIPNDYTPEDGDSIDIYRLSVDKPQLIVSNGLVGITYVDPYPAFGEFGGHRVVYKTVNGDYITENKTFSWVDLGADEDDIVETPYTVINFENGSVEVLYNIELSNSWSKDFKETKYLGGHIQGDWVPGVSRTGSIGTVSVITEDQETIKNLRRLADYAGICHVRTRDGSSYAANVNVSEKMNYSSFELAEYTLDITRVDSESLDGMTIDEWNHLIALQDKTETEE